MKFILPLFLSFAFSFNSSALQSEMRALKPGDSQMVFDVNLKFKEVVRTFSGTINPKILNASLELLAQEQAPAMFFVTGPSAIAQPYSVLKILGQGHVVGSQGMGSTKSKAQFNSAQEAIQHELQVGHELVYSVTRAVFPFVRLSPRHGGIATRQFIKENGVYAIYWNIDYNAVEAEKSIIESLKKENYRGIVSLSLSNGLTVPVLKALLDELKREDVKVIQIVPPEESRWYESPPFIRKSVIEQLDSDGSLIEILKKQKESTI